jgi:ribosomal protein S18 acetylase RimI-like enzyme
MLHAHCTSKLYKCIKSHILHQAYTHHNNNIINDFKILHNETFLGNEFSADFILKILGKNYLLYFLMIDAEFAGYIIIADYGIAINVEYIVVKKEYNGRGYAKLLLDTIKKIYNRIITLECKKELVNLYRKNNFIISDTTDDFYFMVYRCYCGFDKLKFHLKRTHTYYDNKWF